jgi:hypothetical protein
MITVEESMIEKVSVSLALIILLAQPLKVDAQASHCEYGPTMQVWYWQCRAAILRASGVDVDHFEDGSKATSIVKKPVKCAFRCADGTPTNICIVKSSGVPELDKKAAKLIQTAKFGSRNDIV